MRGERPTCVRGCSVVYQQRQRLRRRTPRGKNKNKKTKTKINKKVKRTLPIRPEFGRVLSSSGGSVYNTTTQHNLPRASLSPGVARSAWLRAERSGRRSRSSNSRLFCVCARGSPAQKGGIPAGWGRMGRKGGQGGQGWPLVPVRDPPTVDGQQATGVVPSSARFRAGSCKVRANVTLQPCNLATLNHVEPLRSRP